MNASRSGPFRSLAAVVLLLVVVAMTVRAEDVLSYMDATSRALHSPPVYTTGVDLAPRIADQPGEAAE